MSDGAVVVGVSLSATHGVGKIPATQINLVEGFGVEGDAHYGATVQHLSRLNRHAQTPNLRQVHLVHVELIDDLRQRGFDVSPAIMGENITTRGVDLLGLSVGAQLELGEAIVEITGLRNPCHQLNALQPGLMNAALARDSDGGLIRLLGVMGIVRRGGVVRPDDKINVIPPGGAHRKLQPV